MLEGCSTARQSGHYYHLVGDRFFAEMPACLRSGQIEATYALEDDDGHRAFAQTERTVSGIKTPPLLVGLLSLRDGRQRGKSLPVATKETDAGVRIYRNFFIFVPTNL